MATEIAAPRAGRREWIGLAVLALPVLLISIDVFVLLLALPHLSADLGANSSEQLWIMDVYGFMLAGFLVTMGTLGDRIGRRRLLLTGAAAFSVASVVAAYSTSPEMLIASRALLGVAGATLAPSTLALITNMFRDPRQRSAAIGIWFMCFMGGAAIGPLVGGAMLEHFWWGSAFLLGVPAMVLLLILGPVVLPEYRDAKAGRLDLASVGLSLAAVLPMVYALKELAKDGWAPLPLAALAVGGAFGTVFVRRQQRLEHPLMDLRLFRNRAFCTALGGMFAGTFLMGALMLFITQYLQLVQGLSPLKAGLWMLPAVVASGISFGLAPVAARSVRPARLIGGGLCVSVAGLLLLVLADASGGLPYVVTGFALINLGAGPLVTLGTDLVVSSAPPEKAGSAAALNETSGEFGYALGIAALGSIGTLVYRDRLEGTVPAGTPDPAADTAREGLTGAATAAADLPARAAEALLTPAREAYVGGMHVAAVIAAVLLAGVAVLAVRLLNHVPPTGAAAAAPAESGDPVGPADSGVPENAGVPESFGDSGSADGEPRVPEPVRS
ncbi:MFS transporter [Streptomyces sp. MAR4 CNX-425]|uniref:MFS transporter n=1 Tax=Streptomyces sp. MAR4 CNX-425 TaxID=3406343 RepID=UPI003B5100B1